MAYMDINTEEANKLKTEYETVEQELKEELPFEVEVEEEKVARIKKMHPIGVVMLTYIVAENEDGMYLIDQHAAHERINYEKYLEKLSNHDNNSIDFEFEKKMEAFNLNFINNNEVFADITNDELVSAPINCFLSINSLLIKYTYLFII